MQGVVSSDKDWLDIVIQVLVVVIPIVLAWYFRTYVRGTAAEKDWAAIIRLSNSAIDYVENLDTQDKLELPPEVKKGAYKLKLAGEWLESELQRAGIKMTDEEAQRWIASEFQKRMGDVRMVGTIAQLTCMALDLIQGLEQSKLIEIPPEMDRISYLTELAADWVLAELARRGASISREEALSWVRAELVRRLQAQAGELPVTDRLAKLAGQAVAFLEGLKASGQLSVRPGVSGINVETDIATAWLLTEAAKQGLAVTSDQIAEAVANVLRQRSADSAGGSLHSAPA